MIHLGSFVGADGADGDAPLVFDIDVTDYKDYCSCECATERKTCHLCWPYVQAAMFVISSMLTDVLGVERGDQHWFYSGNRGVHCHVFVGGVVEIDDEARQGVIELLSHTTKIIEQPFHARMWPLFWDHFEKKIRPGNCHKLSAVFGTDVLNEKEHAMRSSWPKLDQAVTGRRSHMIRLPFTQHATSKRYSSAISCSTLDMLTWFPPHLAISAVVGAMKLD
jgi:DNA primase catalytic subunit